MDSESSSLSLTTAGSSINAAFGSVSAGGVGSPESDVTHTAAALERALLSSLVAIKGE
jgi:hypothetical protein